MSATATTASLVTNAIGRRVPTNVNGREAVPYQGVNGHDRPETKPGRRFAATADYPANGDKRVPDLETALQSLRPARWHDHQQPSSSAQW